MLHDVRQVVRLLVLVLLTGWLPQAARPAPSPVTAGLSNAPSASSVVALPPASPVLPSVQSASDPQLPALALGIQIAPDPLAVGETAAISVTIENRAPYPAEDLVVTAPTPTGALALPGPNTISPTQGWRWNVGHLDAHQSLTLTASLRLVSTPPGQALLFHIQATARGLGVPLQKVSGVLIIDRSLGPASTIFTPGAPATLRSRDGRVTVQFPAQGAVRRLTLRHSQTPIPPDVAPATTAGFGRSFGAFFLDATDDQGQAVHQFNRRLTITVRYTPEQLQALNISAPDLTLFWFDEARNIWQPLSTHVDTAAQTISATVDHFTPFSMGDGTSPSENFIPSLQGFRMNLFSGAANYSIPIEVPAGAGGLKPSLQLDYSSATSDGVANARPDWQASWVGKGWSLDPAGSVSLNKNADCDWDQYTFVFGGRSFDVVKGVLLSGPNVSCQDTDPANRALARDITRWEWYAVDEQFVRVQAVEATPGMKDYIWKVWTPDGTRYDFTQALWWGWQTNYGTEPERYKWLLTQVTDPHGNQIVYDYQVDSVGTAPNIFNPTYYLRSIFWNYGGTTTPRYKVDFEAYARTVGQPAGVDADWRYALTQTGGQTGTPHEAYWLKSITVSSLPPNVSQYQPIRKYALEYEPLATSLQTDVRLGQRVLTLKSVQQIGRDGGVLPKTSFTYYKRPDDNNPPGAMMDRLNVVDNGQGGQITFTYDWTWNPPPENFYLNYHKVTSVTRTSGSGQTYNTTDLTTYNYTSPALNDRDHAATVVYAYNPPSLNGDSHLQLARPEKREFRGYYEVVEKHYNGASADPTKLLQEVRHFFHQGNGGANGAACTVEYTTTQSGDQIVDTSGTCFKTMVERESWKGREYQTETYSPSGLLLQQTSQTFGRVELPFFGSDPSTEQLSNNYRRVGLWRAFDYISKTVELDLEGGQTSRSKTTKYFYNGGCNVDTVQTVQYGNIGCVQEFNDASTTPYRITKREYVPNAVTGGPYIVDRMWQEAIYERHVDGQDYLLALTNQFYDNSPPGNLNNVANAIGDKGDLTRVTRYFNVPLVPDLNNQTVSGTDTTYGYDSYGNRNTETTYASAGTRTNTSGALSWSVPGSGSAARTTTAQYDPIFNTYPMTVTNPLGQVDHADYDLQMGTLIRVSGLNVTGTPTNCKLASYSIAVSEETTCARYDEFGRMTALIKPGDSTAFPTLQASYDNYNPATGQPFRYLVQQREKSGQAGIRPIQHFYDGLGREIQVKRESAEGAQNIIVDTVYDGLDRVYQQSQARSVNETPATTFWLYTSPGSLYNPTTTSYDARNRPVDVVLPDNTHATTQFTVGSVGVIATTIDAKGHKTDRETDLFGRLRQVIEYSGNAGSEGGYATYATTTYAYDPLDRLTTMTDAQSSITSISYDSAGRKTGMTDPDMGAWSYQYDANGNLTRQTDARGQRICLYYDALNRLTGKHYRTDDACPTTFPAGAADASYTYDQGTNGKGQRTAMSLAGASTDWLYDGRGHATQATYTVPGLSSTRVFTWTYDSADRVQQIGYPAVGANPRELLTYTYDSAWRPTSACSSFGGCYVSSSQPYTALYQPKQWTFGNGLLQTWSYDTVMQRLQQLQVGTSADPGSLFTRSYTYDSVGNVESIIDPQLPETQHFTYDHRDRLTRAWTTATLGSAPLRQTIQASLDTASATAFAPPASTASRAPHLAGAYPSMSVALTPDMVASDSQASVPPSPAAKPAADARTAAAAPARVDFSRLPLAFVENRGQTNARVRYMVHGAGGTLFFTPDEAVLTLPDPADTVTTTVVRLRYDGANPNPTLSARDRLPGVVNYFRGSNPAQWRTDVPTYAGISYESLYAGITLRYDGTNGQLKSTYLVAPGTDPAQIRWRYLGAHDVQVDAATGDLQIHLPAPGPGRTARTLIERAPLAWQDIGARRVPVTVSYDVASNGSVGFTLGSYDQTQPLTIDPILSYATYHGGNRDDTANAIAIDSSGNTYIAGYTTSNSGFPLQNALDSSYNGLTDAFVSKLNADGSALLWSTYIGGGDQDKANAIALDSSNNVYLAGQTESSGSTAYPTTSSGLDTTYGGGTCSGEPCKDAFFTKLSAAGNSILYSTYMGGNGDDEADGIAVSGGLAYLTGFTAGGMPTKSAYKSTYQGGVADVFVSKINPALSQGNSNIYTTYLGGSTDDEGAAIAVDGSGVAYITGYTDSTNFTITSATARQTSNGGQADVFLAKLGAAGNSLLYGSYLGGSSIDRGNGIAIDSSGNAYLTGYSSSSGFPTQTPWQASRAGDKDAILVEFNPAASGAASLLYSSYIGGTAEDIGMAIALDGNNNVYLTGETQSDNFPTQYPLQASRDASGSCTTPSAHPCSDVFVTEFSITNNAPVYSTYLGGSLDDEGHGITVDSSGAAYVTGYANGTFPTASPRQAASGGQRDAFIVKLTASPSAYDETYNYDTVGNITLKGPTGNSKTYTYGTQSASCTSGALTKRHAVINDGNTTYCYDQNGNMLSGGGRSYVWDAENRPTSITFGGVTETYTYDADGERLKQVRGSTTTVYLAGLWEEVVGGAVKTYYTLNGSVVALRDSGANAVTYLHGDHLGSISLATNAGGQGTPQYFGPWGARRAGGIGQTNRNYTAQYLDGTGLLYYHARYYDPVLARFVSADSVVDQPENQQAFNRYSYVTNNPLKYTDPSGHCRRKNGTFVYAEDCTVDEFNELSWADRRLWVETFENRHGLQGWFDDIKNAIDYLGEDMDYSNPKGWAAHADAAVLQAIQNGQRLSEGKAPIGEHKGDDCLGSCLQAARGWAAFYEAEKIYRTTGIEPKNLYQQRYGAEQGGVDYGVDISDKYYQEESWRVRYRIREFVHDGNQYRRFAAFFRIHPSTAAPWLKNLYRHWYQDVPEGTYIYVS